MIEPEEELKRKYTGNIALYLFCSLNRAPLFLQRNLRSALAHLRQQHEQSSAETSRFDATMKTKKQVDAHVRLVIPVSPPPLATGWNVRELEQLLVNKTFGPQDPVLKIDVTDIRDRLAKYRDAKTVNEPPSKQARISLINGTCALTIWGAGSASQETIVEQVRKCQIHGKAMASGERGASVVMDQPFLVRLDELQLRDAVPGQSFGEPQFAMQIVVMAANLSDAWPPVEMKIPPPKTAPYSEVTGIVRFPVLVAKWHKLPRCPETQQESILDLIASQDGQKYKPKLGLKIDAAWCKPPTPLELANAERRSSQRSLATSSPKAVATSVPIVIEWSFEGLVDFIPRQKFPGYYCPLCAGKNSGSGVTFWFHLISSHDLFDFKFSENYTTEAGQTSIKGSVEVKLSNSYGSRAANTVPDYREVNWVKPKTPLDLEAYLKGDETWLGKNAKRQTNLLVPYTSIDSPRPRSHEQVRHEISLAVINRPADKVPDLIAPIKRKFRVPRAPSGIQFYRLRAKRSLQEGELVSESDDDIDEEWLLQKHADTIDSFTDTTREEKEFIQRFDRHMLKEDIPSDLHAGEALIRFCRINKEWLQQRSMRMEFHKKAATLKLQGCIGSKVIWACMNIINDFSSHQNGNAMDLDGPDSPAGRPKSGETDNSDGSVSPSDLGHFYGRCAICKAGIYHPRDGIRCNNPLCTKPDHHLTCVNLTSRSTHWTCSHCKASTPPKELLIAGLQPSIAANKADGLPIRNGATSLVESPQRGIIILESVHSDRPKFGSGERNHAQKSVLRKQGSVSDASSASEADVLPSDNDEEYQPEVASAVEDEDNDDDEVELEDEDLEGSKFSSDDDDDDEDLEIAEESDDNDE